MNGVPEPGAWLDAEMARLSLNYNRLAQKAQLSPSSITEFKRGRAGVTVCIAIAKVLGVSPLWVMVVGGVLPPLANMRDVDADRIASIYLTLDDENRHALMSFAEFLRERLVRAQLQDD